LFEFQDPLHHATHEEDFPQAFKSMRGRAIEPSLHTQKRRRLVQELPKTSKGRSHLQPPQSPVFIASHKTLGLITKALNIDRLSLVKTKVLTHVWPLGFHDIKDFWSKIILI